MPYLYQVQQIYVYLFRNKNIALLTLFLSLVENKLLTWNYFDSKPVVMLNMVIFSKIHVHSKIIKIRKNGLLQINLICCNQLPEKNSFNSVHIVIHYVQYSVSV